jgi:hypothetical protein
VSRPTRPGRPPTIRSIQAFILHLARENPNWGYRRIHGELAALEITVAPSTVWEILQAHGIEPAPPARPPDLGRLPAQYFVETRTLTGARLYVFAVIEHATCRIHILGTTAHPTAAWTTQLATILVMDLQDARVTMKYLIRDRDSRYTRAFDNAVDDEGIAVVKTGIRVPRMNAIMQRWVRFCRGRTPRPDLDPQPSPPPARPPRIPELLQRAPAPPHPPRRRTPALTARTDHRTGPTRPPRHRQT